MKLVRTVLLLFVLLPFFTIKAAAPIPNQEQPEFPLRRPVFKAPADFYTFLGLGSQSIMFGKASADAAIKLQAEAVAPDKKEERRAELINTYYKEEIIKACKAKREALQRQIEEAKKELERAAELERDKKTYEILKLQYDFHLTTNFCPVLLDPQKRAAYDERLQNVPQEAEEYFAAMRQGINEALMLAPDKTVVLSRIAGDLLADLFVDIPGPALKLFNQNMALRSISLLPVPYGPDVRYGIGFSGLMAFNRFEVTVIVYVIQDIYGEKRASISVELPQHYKLSDLIPSITTLDSFSLPRAKLILANFEGYDVDNFNFKKGFNYAALVDLKGPLAAFNALKEQSKYLKSLVFEAEPIMLSGVINPYDLVKTSFSIRIPLYFGIDLQKVSLIPSVISNVINKVTTDALTLQVLPFRRPTKDLVVDVSKVGIEASAYKISIPSLKFRILAETGARIVLGTQKDPIRLTLNGLVEPASVNFQKGYLSFGANIKNMLQFGDWLEIGNASIQFDFDPALMAVLATAGYPLPFTGLLANGQIGLGKPGDTRAQLHIAGGFRAMTDAVEKKLAKDIEGKEGFSAIVAQERTKIAAQLPEVLFDVRAENIRFADLLSYATKLAAKTGIIKQQIPVTSFPSMTLHNVWGHLALVDTRIADKEYKAGIGLQVETEFWNRKAGFSVHISAPKSSNDQTAFQLSGWGYMPHITMSAKGKEIFRLQGLSDDKGPRLAFLFNPQEPKKGMFTVNGTVIIPGLGLRQAVDFRWYYWWLIADFESKFAGFSVIFGLRMNLKAAPPKTALVVREKQQPDIKEGKQEEEQEMMRPMTEEEKKKYAEFEKWRQLYVKFGFKDDFAEFLNEQLVPALRSLKTRSIEQMNKFSAFIAQQQERGTAAMEQEIAKTDQEIVALKKEIALFTEECNRTSGIRHLQCRASIAAQEAKLKGKSFYRSALLRPVKGIVRGTTQVAKSLAQAKIFRTASEAILEGVSKGIEFVAAGITLLRIREVIGEYSYRDMIDLKLPRLTRLVVELNIGEEHKQFILEDLQFDFKAPKQSCAQIVFEVMQAYTRSQYEKYAKYVPQLMAL